MNAPVTEEIEVWEDEGGAARGLPFVSVPPLCGTPGQVEWAGRIRRKVNAEFDRVAASFRSVINRQSGEKRRDTEAVIAILEEKRAEVMSQLRAGYFIRDWQEISDQVRQMILNDNRYQAIRDRITDGRQNLTRRTGT